MADSAAKGPGSDLRPLFCCAQRSILTGEASTGPIVATARSFAHACLLFCHTSHLHLSRTSQAPASGILDPAKDPAVQRLLAAAGWTMHILLILAKSVVCSFRGQKGPPQFGCFAK